MKSKPTRFQEIRSLGVQAPPQEVFATCETLGRDQDWFYLNWLWKCRIMLDQLLFRPRSQDTAVAGSHHIDRFESPRLLRLSFQFRMPGKGWLEFQLEPLGERKTRLTQSAIFETDSWLGRIYWYLLYPAHSVLFTGLIRRIAARAEARARSEAKK